MITPRPLMAVPWQMYRCACAHEFPASQMKLTVYSETSHYWGVPSEEYVTVKRCPSCGSPAIEPIP